MRLSLPEGQQGAPECWVWVGLCFDRQAGGRGDSAAPPTGPSQEALVVKNPSAKADVSEEGSVPGWGRSPGGGHGNPLQYSCLENPMDRGAWWATAHGVAESRTLLSDLAQHKPLIASHF